MTLAELLQNRFRADLRHRGAAYIEAERISLVRITPENVFAVVQDGAEIQTQLRYQQDDIAMFCTCEQFVRSKTCKHLWATVLATDLGGYVNPALRPGRILPFVAPAAYQPISVDDLSDGPAADGDVSLPRGKSRPKARAAEVPLRPWEARLHELSEDMRGTPDGRTKADPQERQIFYEVDLEASKEAGKLVIQASQRQRRAGGQWGKIKPLKVRPGELDHIEHEDDRTFLSYLAGAVPERNNWSNQQTELRTSAHRFHARRGGHGTAVPALCRSAGRTLHRASSKSRPAPLPVLRCGPKCWAVWCSDALRLAGNFADQRPRRRLRVA